MKTTPLTPEEFEIVKAHTVKGAAILRPITMLQDLVPASNCITNRWMAWAIPTGSKAIRFR